MLRFDRPRFWPTVLTVPALIVLIGLGTWQLQRLAWKTDLLDRIGERMSAAPAPLPARLDDPEAWDYRRVTLAGRFAEGETLHWVARTHDGQAGVELITPLVRADGRPVLVNRGWVPEGAVDAVGPPPTGPVTIQGVARVPPPRGWMRPDNDPDANTWYWVDLDAMAAAAGLAEAAPVLVQAADTDPDALPVGDRTRVTIPNDHLEYALTWYGLAVVLIGVYVAYHRRRDDAAR
ncbi:MAG: SURF1 family protein [Azospirillaceae bacterium]